MRASLRALAPRPGLLLCSERRKAAVVGGKKDPGRPHPLRSPPVPAQPENAHVFLDAKGTPPRGGSRPRTSSPRDFSSELFRIFVTALQSMPTATMKKRPTKAPAVGKVVAGDSKQPGLSPPKKRTPQYLPRRHKQPFFSLRNLLMVVLLYAGFHRFATCPNHGYPPKATAPAVCRTVYSVEKNVIRPGYDRAVQFFKASAPGKAVLNHYNENLRPHVDPLLARGQKIQKDFVRPAAARAQTVLKQYGEPALQKAKAFYVQYVDSRVQGVYGAAKKEYDARLGRHVNKAYAQGRVYYMQKVHSHVGTLVKSADAVYKQLLYPAAQRSVVILYQVSLMAGEAYQQYLGPLAAKTFVAVQDVWANHVLPAAIRIWESHGRPLYADVMRKVGIEVERAGVAGKAAKVKVAEVGKTAPSQVSKAAEQAASKAAGAAKPAFSKAPVAPETGSAKPAVAANRPAHKAPVEGQKAADHVTGTSRAASDSSKNEKHTAAKAALHPKSADPAKGSAAAPAGGGKAEKPAAAEAPRRADEKKSHGAVKPEQPGKPVAAKKPVAAAPAAA
ncbi:MAG: hypothetical protein BJ554DRAFT_461 [Olpidium bornovanus]|uniref:Uncharacterized protein n=1 Tax=Olpidium bornovanus TaxID=278681 RepID=A0A8H8DI43_9FUNG|nr:MAG: hypothetical protein BJ554DRAFT_461 [Olpidium bornovanus]